MSAQATNLASHQTIDSGSRPDTLARKLVVIVPAYNEAQTIERTVETLKKTSSITLDGKTTYQLLVYVIDDGSSDDTGKRAKSCGVDRLLSHKKNLGLGAAVRTGLVAAFTDGADIVVKFDADLQHDPMDIPLIIAPIAEDTADVVYGNRFEKIEYEMPFVRRIGNRVFTTLMGWLTGWDLKDSQPGIFAVNRSYLIQFYMPGDYNYTQQILLDAYHKGMRFAQVPVSFRKRTSGSSFVSFKYPLKVLPQIFLVLVGVKPLLIFGLIGLASILFSSSVFLYELTTFLFGNSLKPVTSVNLVLGSFLFGVQTVFFGILADLIVRKNKSELRTDAILRRQESR